MTTSSILDLGNPEDSRSWTKGCEKLGINIVASLFGTTPTLPQLTEFFRGSPEWVYFSGHFAGLALYNEGRVLVNIDFASDKIILQVGEATKTLPKGADDLQLVKNCEVLVWGGCNACGPAGTVRTLRELFGNPLILGYAGSTGWKINNAMLGGGFIKSAFFNRLGLERSATTVRNAWMATANQGYGGGSIEGMFRAIDPDGQEWTLGKKKIVKGRKF